MKANKSIFRFFCYLLLLSINNINWRFGRHFWCEGSHKQIHRFIYPGMVILTRKRHEFSNLLIPGYWTHAAMIISNEHIVEATIRGVIKTKISELLKFVDDFVILRPAFCTSKGMVKASNHAIEAMGIPYNFTFNHENKAFYCSQLVHWAYQLSVRRNISSTNRKIIIPNSLYEARDQWEVVLKHNII